MDDTRILVLCFLSMTFWFVTACNGQSKNPTNRDSAKKVINVSYEIDPSISKELKEFEKDDLGSGVVEMTMISDGKNCLYLECRIPAMLIILSKTIRFRSC